MSDYRCDLSDEKLMEVELKRPDWLTDALVADMAEEVIASRARITYLEQFEPPKEIPLLRNEP